MLEVDNPEYQAGNPDSIRTVAVVRELRDDPLGQMHDRYQINAAQYEAGRLFQSTWERAGRSGRIKGMDTTQEPVDGSPPPSRGMSDRALIAGRRLDTWKANLGAHGWRLAVLVLIDKRPLRECAQLMHVTATPANTKYVGRRFREILDALTTDMGLAS